MDQWIHRGGDLQRVAAGDARGGDAIRPGLSDCRACRYRRRCWRSACCLRSGKSAPRAAILSSLVIVALGVVVGFPLLTALALQHVTSAHSIVFIGLLPLVNGDLRRGARRRAAEARILDILRSWQRIGGRLRAGAGADRLARRRCLDACRHHRLRARLCRRRQAVAHAWRLAGDLLGARPVACRS